MYHLDRSGGAARWQDLVDGDDGLLIAAAGISHYFFIPQVTGGTPNFGNRPRVTLGYIAENWKKSNVAPLLLSCRQTGSASSTENISHDYEGCNGVMYDGSGRWISLDEVMEHYGRTDLNWNWNNDPEDMLDNDGPLSRGGPMQEWARQMAKP